MLSKATTMLSLRGVLVVALAITAVTAFLTPTATIVTRCRLSTSFSSPQESNSPNLTPEQQQIPEEQPPVVPRKQLLPKMSRAIPFLERPPYLTGELAGDAGFDPLRLAKDREGLFLYREAEIKHARLAMLAAAGWPMSELYNEKIATYFGMESALESADQAPTILNGGLDKISPVWWGFCLGLCASIDLYQVQRARSMGIDSDYVPGDLSFDPLGLYPDDAQGKKRMQLAEIKHGRVAMIAVLAYSIEEAIFKEGIVDETPIFFYPLTHTIRGFLEGLL